MDLTGHRGSRSAWSRVASIGGVLVSGWCVEVAWAVRLWCLRRDVPLKRVARALGLSPAGLSRRLTGRTAWTVADVAGLRGLGVPVPEFPVGESLRSE